LLHYSATKQVSLPVLDASTNDYGQLALETVADGGYANQNNVTKGREVGVERVVFNKRCGLGSHAMGVKKKTFDRLRDFRAVAEGNISELKRAFGVAKPPEKSTTDLSPTYRLVR
jgi:IS5 family transposase